ncbi:polyprenyl synthetase family protein [Schinkia azotoformans]|uniref:polyprenyl synthetase family protein n=1 Tax=Schinkia azotoformans TaxID=1454 RepID=UPI002DB7EDD4|nr:polyprenyl synthetase family protein [Schinkia azotoformans]MEC1716217.1 polyprenyl synthetase family protein [Schinkia azotoformans]MEC1778136.1 polyprenyl synthetase family protein [Schinkia azotoformans]MED4328196.1 polyprenyl synthetase family protein [Schinkia azotoformans]
MERELIINAEASYRLAEQKASHYFKLLHEQVIQKKYVPTLTNDFQSWKQNHIHHSFLSLFLQGKSNPAPREYYNYIHWLNKNRKLDHYLNRSVSYIFLRDLGKALDSPDTKKKIQRVVESIKNHLTNSTTNQGDKIEVFSIAGLYRWAQKEGVESTIIWLINKLKTVSILIPEGMDVENAQRKLIKIIAGVLMHELEEKGNDILQEDRSWKLNRAIRLGYSYGLTYPFIDDLLDANVLSVDEKKQYSDLIRSSLLTGSVSEIGEWTGDNSDLIKVIYSELKDAFEYIRDNQSPDTTKKFFEQSYIFFNSQEEDREKDLSHPHYTNEELYIPIILKSSTSRLIARSVISAHEDKDFESRTFYYGIYNQLADDFADMFDDMGNGMVTPYTYYLKYHDKRSDLLNPFELYWTVISHLIHNVYDSETKTREVILDRAINGLKRFKERMGENKYNEVMGVFASGNPSFNRIIQKMVQKAGDVDFFDKLLRDHIITDLRNERKEQEDFLNTIKTARNQIDNILRIPKDDHLALHEPITDAANYILEGDGKRLRPIITWVMAIDGYGLKSTLIVPLLRSLEYMHTASLIFDDLPSQDNASIRRGRTTLHQLYNIATAELTGLFLTQKAVEEQASLAQFDSKAVLHLIRYSAKTAADMCKGQVIDLDSKGKQLTLEQLNLMCFYKTGLGFEAPLIMPAILANANESEIKSLKTFAKHAGIAFQIKDDLLDVEGELDLLGKPVGKDAKNNNSTFVSILGQEGAKRAMWEHYCLAMEVLEKVPRNTLFLKHLLNYLVNRDH